MNDELENKAVQLWDEALDKAKYYKEHNNELKAAYFRGMAAGLDKIFNILPY